MVVPEPPLERSTGESEAQAATRLAQQKARQAERRAELSRRLAHLAVAPGQPELL